MSEEAKNPMLDLLIPTNNLRFHKQRKNVIYQYRNRRRVFWSGDQNILEREFVRTDGFGNVESVWKPIDVFHDPRKIEEVVTFDRSWYGRGRDIDEFS